MQTKHEFEDKAQLLIRPATMNDSMEALVWKNDIISRNASLDSNLIHPSDHENWFNQAIKDKKKLVLIGEYHERKIGIVRFEADEKKFWRVSINVNPICRGEGWGKVLLPRAGDYFFRNKDTSCILIALVKETNFASIKLFEYCGYVLDKHVKNTLYYKFYR